MRVIRRKLDGSAIRLALNVLEAAHETTDPVEAFSVDGVLHETDEFQEWCFLKSVWDLSQGGA